MNFSTLFLEEAKQWRIDLNMMTTARSRAFILVYAFNWASRRDVLRTDREHKFCRWLAAFAHRALNKPSHARFWCDSASGRRLAVPR